MTTPPPRPEDGGPVPGGPPDEAVAGLLEGPSAISAFEWHDEVGSTNLLASEAARAGAPDLTVVGADVQTGGRGRRGRQWHAPAGTSLQLSMLLRPRVDEVALPLLGLLAGVVVAEAASLHVGDVDVGLKWPNDLLVDGRKSAGILSERVPGAVIVGIGVNIDWRGVERPPGLEEATSLAEAAGSAVDRWQVLCDLLHGWSRRYLRWQEDPSGVLGPYRQRCVTIGRGVRVLTGEDDVVEGVATEVGDDGALVVVSGDATHRLHVGEVVHVRAP